MGKNKTDNKYFASEFNMGFVEKDIYFLFNTLRGNFVKFSRDAKDTLGWLAESRNKIKKYNSNGIDKRWKTIPDDLKKVMISGGFVVPQEFNEDAYLRFRNKAARFNLNSLSLTVLPTTNCNLRCKYCYECLSKDCMSPKVAKHLLDFVKTQLERGIKDLSVCWYGGEPLLRYKQICELSRKFISSCKKYKARYSGSIITNGVLFTRERAKKLKKLGVTFAQITLDGPPDVHDKRRPSPKGGSFNKILKNVCDTCDLININLRCNIDKSNVNDAKKLVDILVEKGLQKKVYVYFAPVHDSFNVSSAVCKNYGSGCNKLYSFKDFAPLESELTKYAEKKGFKIEEPPQRRFSACTADMLNSFVVEPKGGLQKCWEYVGTETEQIGTLSEGVDLDEKTLKWYNYDPFLIRKCKTCKIFPACLGWCPARLLVDKSEASCQTMKFNLIAKLKNYYKSGIWKKQNKSTTSSIKQ
ncbi:MAG: radical SAM protein [Pseudomonadota bacterium]